MKEKITNTDPTQQIAKAQPGSLGLQQHQDPEELLECDDCVRTGVTDPQILVMEAEDATEEEGA